MNRGLNLPAIQKIMNDFEKESSMMDMKEEMMSDAVDDVMDDEVEDEEEEGDKILRQVLDEIGVDLSQQVWNSNQSEWTTTDTMEYSLLRRQLDLAPYPHPLPRVVDQWQSEKQVGHLMETTDKVVMLPLLTKTPFRHVWMLCVVVDSSTMFTRYGMESNLRCRSKILVCI